jgi:hypothetical protein
VFSGNPGLGGVNARIVSSGQQSALPAAIHPTSFWQRRCPYWPRTSCRIDFCPGGAHYTRSPPNDQRTLAVMTAKRERGIPLFELLSSGERLGDGTSFADVIRRALTRKLRAIMSARRRSSSMIKTRTTLAYAFRNPVLYFGCGVSSAYWFFPCGPGQILVNARARSSFLVTISSQC